MRVVIASGGTGGHLYPGLALAEELLRRGQKTEVIFIGTEKGIEARVVPREGYPIKFIPGEGFIGVSLLRKFRSLNRFMLALKECYTYLKSIRPDLVVGSGGYASFAPLLSAWLLSIPTMIMEQNTVPGKANILLAYIVRSICATYQESLNYFPRGKVYLTGNPVRETILKGNRSLAQKLFSLRDDLFTIFIFGGSSGAMKINHAVVNALQHLLDVKDEIQFLHQTGERDFEFVREAYRSHGYHGTVTQFIYQMSSAYAVADLVISRAGATTLSEICITGKAAILIPYPYAAANHQEVNAVKLEKFGAAVMIRDAELNSRTLSEEIRKLYHNREFRELMGKKALSLGTPNAVKNVADIAMSLIKER